jgi:hypothetical protein
MIIRIASHCNDQDFQVTLDRDIIADSNKVKDLEVIIRSGLTFTSHIN